VPLLRFPVCMACGCTIHESGRLGVPCPECGHCPHCGKDMPAQEVQGPSTTSGDMGVEGDQASGAKGRVRLVQ